MRRLPILARASLAVFGAALIAVVGACRSDESATSAAIQSFCQSFISSPAFSCCTANDKASGVFLVRYRYNSVAECVNALSLELSQSYGHQVFDAKAASTCLAYLNARQCGIEPTIEVEQAEETAGCGRVLGGVEDEGDACSMQEDCKPGLFCPSAKDTGSSSCSKPAGFNQDCFGQQASSVDHPACAQGLLCIFQGVNQDGCPSPPCLEYQCVPPYDQGDPCEGLECGQGLFCTDGSCEQGGPNPEGGFCRLTEHCQAGLYCDTGAGACAPRKDDGQPCSVANNPIFECKGICVGSLTSGTCTSFCGP